MLEIDHSSILSLVLDKAQSIADFDRNSSFNACISKDALKNFFGQFIAVVLVLTACLTDKITGIHATATSNLISGGSSSLTMVSDTARFYLISGIHLLGLILCFEIHPFFHCCQPTF